MGRFARVAGALIVGWLAGGAVEHYRLPAAVAALVLLGLVTGLAAVYDQRHPRSSTNPRRRLPAGKQ